MAKSYFYDEGIADWRELVKGEQGERGPVGPIGPQGPAIDIEAGLPISVDTSVGTRVYVGDVMIHGDTGWRDVSGLLREGWEAEGGRYIEMRRENSTVYVRGSLVNTSTSDNFYILLFPTGFRPLKYGVLGTARLDPVSTGVAIANGSASRLEVLPGAPAGSEHVQVLAAFSTPQDWPTSLPGTPV